VENEIDNHRITVAVSRKHKALVSNWTASVAAVLHIAVNFLMLLQNLPTRKFIANLQPRPKQKYKQGIETPKQNIHLIRACLKVAQAHARGAEND
jgi:hypothetical protein